MIPGSEPLFGAALHVRQHPEQRARLCEDHGAEFTQNYPGNSQGWDRQSRPVQLCSCHGIPDWVGLEGPKIPPSATPGLLPLSRGAPNPIKTWMGKAAKGEQREQPRIHVWTLERSQQGPGAGLTPQNPKANTDRCHRGIPEGTRANSLPREFSGIVQPARLRGRRGGKAKPRWIRSMPFPKNHECPSLPPWGGF